ncbi:hypothetical protein Q9R20_13600 [Microbacterium sp. PRF11]|jgi:multidrug efflux pump subunit AcrA (membrane-fusion protein)|uniref:hypothetical protein n=1 Tax=Microbacterium sp. PRF11 TaxID=2962593 RepID=UPI00288184C9|nr:hypothetical protein [Microbacterium sp. PRF11]MDT0118019.1 hypothetical protein [Microbacterium sp. PRF11]
MMMVHRLDIRLGPLLDQASRFEAQAAELAETSADLRRSIESLRASTSGEASEAAIVSSERALSEVDTRRERLMRNAGVVRKLADVYDTCDLAGARALGA